MTKFHVMKFYFEIPYFRLVYGGGIISMIKENPNGCLNPEMVHQLWTHWQPILVAKLMPVSVPVPLAVSFSPVATLIV